MREPRASSFFVPSCCALACVFAAAASAAAPRDPFTLDRAAERWVEQTLKKLTLDEKIGQLIVPSFESNFLSTDSDTFETLTRLVRDYHVGGFHVFGASQPAPSGAAELRLRHGDSRPAVVGGVPDQPAAGAVDGAAAEHRRLRDRRRLPHLRRDDVSRGRWRWGRSRARTACGWCARKRGSPAIESRALGVQVNFAPIADVNNNPRNPVINMRSYGEDPDSGRRAGRRLRRRRARRRDDRDDQAFSRARRHRRRQPSRPAGDHVRSRAARGDRAACRSAAASSRAPRR